MAHRQWSQEQYKFRFFRFRLVAKVPLKFFSLIDRPSSAFFFETFSTIAFRSSLVSFYRLLLTRQFGFRVRLIGS